MEIDFADLPKGITFWRKGVYYTKIGEHCVCSIDGEEKRVEQHFDCMVHKETLKLCIKIHQKVAL